MMKSSGNMLEVDDHTKVNPSLVRCSTSVPNTNHVEPHTIVQCTEASSVGREEEAKRCTKEQAPTPALQNLKMQTSEVCHKNFVIIDHCDRQSTVILHPSWLQSPPDPSSLEPRSLWEMNGFLSSLQAFNTKSLEAMIRLHSPVSVSPASRNIMEPALRVQQKASNMLIDFVGSDTHDLEKEAVGISKQLDLEQESLSDFQENTEEINALLSSDDELSSTGHSPSDAVSNCHSGAMYGSVTNILGKKRKLEESAVDEVDDADSGSGELAPGSINLIRSLGSCSSSHSYECGPNSTQAEIDSCKTSCRNRQSSTFHVPELMTAGQNLNESKQSFGTIDEVGLMGSARRTKIKNNVQQLKSVIPGGQLLDTAGVLGRTIQYVKCLQSRLRGVETAREPVRPMQQIG